MKNPKGIVLPLLVAVVSGGSLWWVARSNAALRDEQVRLRGQIDDAANLKAVIARAQSVSISDQKLRELTQAAAEASAVQERVETLKNESGLTNSSATKSAKQRGERWRNLGTETPGNTLQSVVWAATGGEVDALVSMLAYDAEGRAAADELYAAVPEDSRKLFPSADKLVASFIAGRLPTNYADLEIVEQSTQGDDAASALVLLSRPTAAGGARAVTLKFQRRGSSWQLVVPQSVILDFRKSLNAE